ncbi:MAG: hypothetical protein J6S41_05920 [Clostridia bacterium]|nr:hypothetical protein [Clostridia bacterium]
MRGRRSHVAQRGGNDRDRGNGACYLGNAVRHAGAACHRMLGVVVTAARVGTVDVRIEIGIAHGEIEQLDAVVLKLAAQRDRLGVVGLDAAAFLDAKAQGILVAVV